MPSSTRLFSRSHQPRGPDFGFMQHDYPSLTSALSSGSWTDGVEGNNVANVDEQISCTYRIENAGTQTLVAFCLIDDNAVGGGDGCIDCGDAAEVDRPPLGGFSCTTTYKVLLDGSEPIAVCGTAVLSHGGMRHNLS